VLRQAGEAELYGCFRAMSDAYIDAFAAGQADAVARVIDFYSGAGSFAAFPSRVREYLVSHTPSNVLDWKSMYGFDTPLGEYARIAIPTLIVRGTQGHAAMNRIAELLHESIPGASLVSIDDASHFLLATHATLLARLIADHVTRVEALAPRGAPTPTTRRVTPDPS
jgi:pimeloyl-ACP methyl ester carboxylesterase